MRRHRDVMSSDLLEPESPDDSDLMSGLGNLADCMLVIVCGLMVAFLVHYNVFENTQYTKVEPTGVKIEADQDPQQSDDSAQSSETGSYKKLGTLYQDEETGEMYYLNDEEDGE
ncbi:MAG: DUF2149 domain-containing protein [Coriobacteriia bacterium]|nr:DUF2149 domain-containing protein [Coriobacteriia bacterium]